MILHLKRFAICICVCFVILAGSQGAHAQCELISNGQSAFGFGLGYYSSGEHNFQNIAVRGALGNVVDIGINLPFGKLPPDESISLALHTPTGSSNPYYGAAAQLGIAEEIAYGVALYMGFDLQPGVTFVPVFTLMQTPGIGDNHETQVSFAVELAIDLSKSASLVIVPQASSSTKANGDQPFQGISANLLFKTSGASEK